MRFARHVMTLWMLMSGLLFAIVSGYRTASGSGELAAWGVWLCNGNPCFMGIVLGITTRKEIAVALKYLVSLKLLKEFNEVNYSASEYVASGKMRHMYISVSTTPDGLANFIDLILLSDDTDLGIPVRNILQVLGSPCAVGFFIDDAHPRLLYPTAMIDVTLTDAQATEVTTFASYILMTPREMAEALRCSSTETLPVVKWEGFATLQHPPAKIDR